MSNITPESGPESAPHIPVLCQELCDMIPAKPGDTILDATIGFGGHARALLANIGPTGRYIGFDQDPDAIAYCQTYFQDDTRVILHHANFAMMRDYVTEPVNHIIIDLGVSSYQLDQPHRGFSVHHHSAPLDMRMNTTQTRTAASILMTYNKADLIALFEAYADLKSLKLVDRIIQYRQSDPIQHSGDLIKIIKQSFYFNNSRQRYIGMSQRIFQALRIAVNAEYASIKTALLDLPNRVLPGGRVAIIAFHSGESRLIKRMMPDCFKSVNKKVIQATRKSRRDNTRSACAQLRVYEMIIDDLSLSKKIL